MLNLKKSLFYKNFFIYAIGLLSSGFISFFSIPLVIKYYGVETYGIFSLIQNIILISISFGSGWLNQNVIRFNNYGTIFKISIYKLCILTLLLVFMVNFTIFICMGYSTNIILVGSFTTVIGILSSVYVTFSQSKFKAKSTVLSNLLRVGVFLLFIIILNKSLNSIVISLFLSYLSLILFFIKDEFLPTKFAYNSLINKNFLQKIPYILKENLEYIKYGGPLALWFTVSAILNISDRYIIKYYFNDELVGVYSSIYDMLYKGITMFCSPILIAGFPIITKYYNFGNISKAYNMIKKLILVEFIFLILVIFIGYYLRDFFILKVLNLPINETTRSLIIPLIISVFMWQIAMLVHKPMELKKQTIRMLIAVALSLFVNIVINILYIPSFGILFAAYSSIVSSLVYILSIMLMKR